MFEVAFERLMCCSRACTARLGKLMLNKKALQKDPRDEFEEALASVLEDLEEELGLSLE